MTRVISTVDLGFGDAGKGSIVDYLTRREQAHTVVRYNGGAQAAHRVVTPEPAPREHVFSQFSSGTLAGAATHLSRFVLLDPLAMQAEAAHLGALGFAEPFAQVTIDQHALVITPFQRAINRLREIARGAARHGSCGMGIGETMADALAYGERVLRAGDLVRPVLLRERLAFLHGVNRAKLDSFRAALPDTQHVADELALLDSTWQAWLPDAYAAFAQAAQIVSGDHLARLLKQPGTVIFEGAQGVLLDEWRGFHPYTTWSTTTLEHAETLLREAGFAGPTTRLGLTRAYTTRHGAGPLPSEDRVLGTVLPDACNLFGSWQGGFRVGWLDLVLLRYASDTVGPLDGIALTCLDRVSSLPEVRVCDRYVLGATQLRRLAPSPVPRDLVYQQQLTSALLRCQPVLTTLDRPDDVSALVCKATSAPVVIESHGPSAADKRELLG